MGWIKDLFTPLRKQCKRCRKTFYHFEYEKTYNPNGEEIEGDAICPHCGSKKYIVV